MSRFQPKLRWWSATARPLSRFAPPPRAHARRLSVEHLEDRTVLSTTSLLVNTLADDPGGPITGQTSLRDAITQADADTANQYEIAFAVTGTVDLTSPLPDLSNNIDLEGPGVSALTVQRDINAVPFSVFTVDSSATVTLAAMTITGGDSASYGGGIYNAGTLSLTDGAVSGNATGDNTLDGYGGGIYNVGTLTVTDSTFANNSAVATNQ